jgi:hypothetical protein
VTLVAPEKPHKDLLIILQAKRGRGINISIFIGKAIFYVQMAQVPEFKHQYCQTKQNF